MRSKKIKKFFLKLFQLLPIDSNKIVAANFKGKGVGGETGKIINRLLIADDKAKVYWLTNEEIQTNRIVSVRPETISSLYHLATAKIWLDNHRKPSYVRKRPNQYYIQTWHGEACLKYVEADTEDTLDPLYIKEAKNDSLMADYFVSGSEWRTKNYQEAFWYNGQILRANLYGRLEEKGQLKISIKKKYNISKNSKILLYAPTFRTNVTTNYLDIDLENLATYLEDIKSEEWTILVRLHPSEKNKVNTDKSNKIIDVSHYPYFEELLAVSDIVISDYSGIIIDCYKNKIPLFLYCPDYTDYIKNNRELYFDIRKLPSSIAFSYSELRENILEFNSELYQKQCELFETSFGFYENDGVEVVVNKILDLLKLK